MDGVTHIEGVELTPLAIIEGEAGRILHAMRAAPGEKSEFGEVYFSTVRHGATKGWKKHRRMTLNIVVPVGAIGFYLLDDRGAECGGTPAWGRVDLGPGASYQRLTVPPGIWMAFRGIAPGESMLMNIASIPHDPNETDTLPLGDAMFEEIGLSR